MSSTELASSLTFPIKLRRIVDSPETDYLIYWDTDGNSFHIADENQFARDIIPNYFKHSNISSFIRQLNMYGFHKVNRIENGLAVVGTGNDDSQWVHPNFVRDKPEILSGVIRKVINSTVVSSLISKKPVSNNNANEIVPYDSVKMDIARLAKMVQYLKKRDEETSEQLQSLQSENHELHSELMFLREQHEKQSKCIDMLIEFFSQYANKPHTMTSRLKPKRNILALECPPPRYTYVSGTGNEPPRKYFVTTPTDSTCSNSTNDLYKGKKVIKISNFEQTPQIDVTKTNKMLSSINNNGIYRMPTLNSTQSQKPPVIYSLSLSKNTNTNNTVSMKPIRAITAANNSPTSVMVPLQSYTPSNQTLRLPPRLNSNTKSVNISTQNMTPGSNFNTQFVNKLQTRNGNYSDIIDHNPTSQVIHNVTLDSENTPRTIVTNIISGISSNVNSVEQCLNDINDMFDNDQSFDNLNYLDQSPMGNGSNHEDDDWKMLLDNIIAESSLRDSDPDQIKGHELIPFTGASTSSSLINQYTANSNDSYSIDDLLQTPDINPVMSTPSLDHMGSDDHTTYTSTAAGIDRWM